MFCNPVHHYETRNFNPVSLFRHWGCWATSIPTATGSHNELNDLNKHKNVNISPSSRSAYGVLKELNAA